MKAFIVGMRGGNTFETYEYFRGRIYRTWVLTGDGD